MVVLQDFINQWSGKKLEFDGAFLYQCVDLVKKWNSLLGYGPRSGNGKDWINNAGNEYLRYDYKSGMTPIEGDIYSFRASPGNSGGHTGVVISANPTTFTSFDQNFPVGSPCHVQLHDYKLMLGWIRPKTYSPGGGAEMVDKKYLAPSNGNGRPTYLYQYPGDPVIRYAIPSGEAYTTNGFNQVPFEQVAWPDNPAQAAKIVELEKKIAGMIAVTPQEKAFIDALRAL